MPECDTWRVPEHRPIIYYHLSHSRHTSIITKLDNRTHRSNSYLCCPPHK